MADKRPDGQSSKGPGTNDTTEYAPSKAPDTQEHAEERNHDGRDMRLIPGGRHGAPVAIGMDALDREAVPGGAENPGMTDYGDVDDTSRPH